MVIKPEEIRAIIADSFLEEEGNFLIPGKESFFFRLTKYFSGEYIQKKIGNKKEVTWKKKNRS